MHRILLVEDHPALRRLEGTALERWGFEVTLASTAEEAQAELSDGLIVDLMITDWNLPGAIDGHALARWLQAHQPDAKILLVTGFGFVRSAAGIDDSFPTLIKPYTTEVLLNKIQELLGTQPSG